MTLRLNSTGGGHIEIDAPNTASNFSVTMPTTAGEIVVANTSGDVDLGGLTVSGSAADDSVNIDSSGRLLVGTSTARGNFYNGANTTQFQVEGTSYQNSSQTLICNNANAADTPILGFAKSAGSTIGSNTIVASGDKLGELIFQGNDGSEFVQSAKITAEVDGTPGANDMPGRLVFSTTADGASSPTERMRIRQNGEFWMYDVYTRTDAASVNVVVKSDGSLRRSVSSIKYKTDVETLQDSYADAILNVRPVWYRSLCEGNCPEHSWWGFIAEEVAEIDPRLVHWKTVEITHDENGSAVQTPCDPEPEGVAYDRFVPHLLNLIKRQKEQIETQGAAIAALEAKVAALEANP